MCQHGTQAHSMQATYPPPHLSVAFPAATAVRPNECHALQPTDQPCSVDACLYVIWWQWRNWRYQHSSTDPDFGPHMVCLIDLILLWFAVYVLWQSLVLVETWCLCVKPRKLPKISVTVSALWVPPASASSGLRCAECKTRCNVVTGQPTGPRWPMPCGSWRVGTVVG